MSIFEKLKAKFAKPTEEVMPESRLSLGIPPDDVEDIKSRDVPLTQTAQLSETVDTAEPDLSETLSLPLLGKQTAARHNRTLLILFFGSLTVLAVLVFWILNQTSRVSNQQATVGQALLQSQRLAKTVSQAVSGSAQAFPEVAESVNALSKAVEGLLKGDEGLGVEKLGDEFSADLSKLETHVDATEEDSKVILGQQKILTQIGSALRLINRQSSDLLEITDSISALKLQQAAPPAEISAAGQLVMLTQRISKSTNEFMSTEGGSPEAVFLLGKDLNTFKELNEALLNGNAEMKISAAKDATLRERLQTLLKTYDETKSQAGTILENLQGLVAAREAEASILSDSEFIRHNLEDLQVQLSERAGIDPISLTALFAVAILTLAFASGVGYVQVKESQRRQVLAEGQQVEADKQRLEAKRVNDANQAAILRLMNELQTVAEGDLTQEATVTEDITGAIADSVNYTVEELRLLVSSVQNTVGRVTKTTSEVDATSTELLAASNEQLHEIRATGNSVLEMADRIKSMSSKAQESAAVARQSLQAAEQGLQAVQNSIGGMNAIRDQIQESAKRIKRLGESSQEIGEITELISDITEQTNVLALNAAIQAASAGDAGRGFSVVAEEVQRLAERSADATRQIATLVKTIQTDTQDAIGAMERSTQGVVEGAKLSDNAGAALAEIDRVSRQVAELIEQISASASEEAGLASGVANNIQHIFAVTEQTGEGTRLTANQIRELSRMAEDLRQSVSRFKIA